MLVLIGIGLLAGVVTALSPCVLPVLPILLAGSAAGGRRRPLAIVAGLVGSFTLFTLTTSWLLDRLGLPQDFLRNLALALLFLLGAMLVVPQLGELVARPLSRVARRPAGDLGGGMLLGASLGLVFVPCAGPVLAAVTVVAATQDVGGRAIALTLSYAIGAAVPMLLIAAGGQRLLRPAAPRLRQVFGAVILVTAFAIAAGLDRPFQTALPGYTEFLQEKVERSESAKRELARVTGTGGARAEPREDGALEDFGVAPEFSGIVEWQNGPARTMAGLRGKVVLIDFWTYSCVNCIRTLPYVKAWHEAYAADGLVIVGVHSPEFAFERVPANVRRASRELGVEYPVALDNGFQTWGAWRNQYWPAKYLVDRRGHIRYAHFGEGEYEETERAIRALLGERGEEMVAAGVRAETATRDQWITPETYLGWGRIGAFVGDSIVQDEPKRYRLSRYLPVNHLTYGGEWTVEKERIVAGSDARLRLHFEARDIHLVLSGRGTVEALVDGKPAGTTRVTEPRLYTLLRLPKRAAGVLELRFSRGVSGYAFTFG
jgi:cytochrome c biogenesis protein CcdA/thiol-disulfide isomerase/thioredoxin